MVVALSKFIMTTSRNVNHRGVNMDDGELGLSVELEGLVNSRFF